MTLPLDIFRVKSRDAIMAWLAEDNKRRLGYFISRSQGVAWVEGPRVWAKIDAAIALALVSEKRVVPIPHHTVLYQLPPRRPAKVLKQVRQALEDWLWREAMKERVRTYLSHSPTPSSHPAAGERKAQGKGH